MENAVTATVIDSATTTDSAGDAQPVDVSTLVQWFESAEDASTDARKLAERDRDYYDNKQWTAEERATLEKRGQPALTYNRIKRKIDFMAGLEKRQRANPKAMPRTPMEEEAAAAFTDAIRYVVDDQKFNYQRSAVWKNMCVEGAGGYAVGFEQKPNYPGLCVTIRRVPWDRMFWDPHSSEADFSDAMYLGVVVWQDESEAKQTYANNPDIEQILTDTFASISNTDTYDDKPKFDVWADKKRRRVRIVQMCFKPDGKTWYYAEFTKGGLLKGGISPYKTDDGETDCEFAFQSAYVDRDNNRYGPVREMIDPQDEQNKRRSKLLHLLSVRQLRIDPAAGAVADVEEARKELARADGVLQGAKDGIEILNNADQVAGQFQLLQQNTVELDTIGANSALLGEQAGAPSGKAIQLNQSGGMVELGDLFDGLRHLDQRVFEKVAYRIKQGWTAEKWIRVTDDDSTVRFVGFNSQVNPEALPQNASVMSKPVAQVSVDIQIEDAPESISPTQENFNALVQLKQADPTIPTEFLIEAIPGLRNRKKIEDALAQQRQPDPMQEQAKQIALAGEAAKIGETESKTLKNRASALKDVTSAHIGEADAITKRQQAQQKNYLPIEQRLN